jgi:protein O-GlcNAc transferase
MEPLCVALHRNPLDIQNRKLLAQWYCDRGMWDKAFIQYLHLLAMNPTNACHCRDLGVISQIQGDIQKAMQWHQRAIELDPSHANPFLHMGNCLQKTKQATDAERNYRKAIALDGGLVEAHSHLGNLLRETARPKKAIRSYLRALRLDPSCIHVWENLGNTYEDQGQWMDAIGVYQRVLTMDSQRAISVANLVHCLTMVCHWNERDGWLPFLLTLVEKDVAQNGYSFLVQPHHALAYPWPADRISFIARAFGSWIKYNTYNTLPPNIMGQKPGDVWQPTLERLRIGYISSDFGNHPLSQLMQHSFAMHDRTHLEVFGYALSANDGTVARQLIEAGIEHFFDVHHLSMASVCDLMRHHRIHILIDLNGYTRGARPEILAMRPVSIQTHYMGFAGSLGASFVDYLITDRVASPPEVLPLYTEKLAMMPHSFFVNDHMQSYPLEFCPKELVTRYELGLPPNRFIYACFNQLSKIDPSIFDVWMRLLQYNSNTVLWLLRFPPAAEPSLRHIAESIHRVAPDRLYFTPVSADKERYMRFIHCADLALDTPRYNGHTTACDVLWAGVPIVTLCGTHMASRVCASVLTALQCTELICCDILEYQSLATHLAKTTSQVALLALRNKVRTNRLTTPLFNTRQWVKNVEALYRNMALRATNGQMPDHLFV